MDQLDNIILIMPTEKETEKEFVWVTKEFAETIKKLGALDSSVIKIKSQYANIKDTTEYALEDIEASYGRLKAAIDTRNEMLEKANEYDYEKWEEIHNKFGSYQSKISNRMKEVSDYVDELNKKIDKINPYKIEVILNAIEKFNNMSDRDKNLLSKLLEFEV